MRTDKIFMGRMLAFSFDHDNRFWNGFSIGRPLGRNNSLNGEINFPFEESIEELQEFLLKKTMELFWFCQRKNWWWQTRYWKTLLY